MALYKKYDKIGSVVHTHSEWATSWAEAGLNIPCFGTTHADYYYGDIPCTRKLNHDEIQQNYEYETGKVIIETLERKNIKPLEMPGVIVFNHGPFTWGETPLKAVHNAKVMEEVAKMAFRAKMLNNDITPIEQVLLDKHYLRNHGEIDYYSQSK